MGKQRSRERGTWHTSEAAEVLRALETDAESGLSDEEAARRLEERANRLEVILGHKPRVEMLAGNPAEVILEATRTAGPTLVAVGRRGLGSAGRMRLGSVSTKVVRAAPGSALVCCPHVERD